MNEVVRRCFAETFGRELPVRRLAALFPTEEALVTYFQRVLCFTKAVIEPLERKGMRRGDSIVDLACGDGQMTVALTLLGYANVTLYDLDAKRLHFARDVVRAVGGDAPTIHASAVALGEDFDVLICYQTIEHLSREGNYAPASRACQREFLSTVDRRIGKLAYFNAPNALYPKDKHDTNLWFFHWLPMSLRRRLIDRGFARSSWRGIAEPVSVAYLARHLRHFRLVSRYHAFDDPLDYMANYPPFDYMGTPHVPVDLERLPWRKRVIIAGSRVLGAHAQNLLPVLSLVFARRPPRTLAD